MTIITLRDDLSSEQDEKEELMCNIMRSKQLNRQYMRHYFNHYDPRGPEYPGSYPEYLEFEEDIQ